LLSAQPDSATSKFTGHRCFQEKHIVRRIGWQQAHALKLVQGNN